MASRTLAVDPAVPCEGAEVIRPRAFQRPGDDEALVREAIGGDLLAREALFDRHGDEVERLLYRVLGCDPEIADAIQDVFLEVFRHLGRLRDPRAIRGWLRAVTVATARKRIRARQRRRWLRFVPQDELPEPEAVEAGDEVLSALEAVYAILDAMGTDLRIAFALRYLEGMELTEVAQACGVSLATIKRRLRKAEPIFVRRARTDPHLVEWMDRSRRWEAP
jgi:RNA polymerase sigma-70 factor, ECF subfamily